ncbi:MAG: endonuclease V [Bacteroidales bacterium]|nr:endonuclease V [Bacteroidales bacterium]
MTLDEHIGFDGVELYKAEENMKYPIKNITPKRAIEQQVEIAPQLIISGKPEKIKIVAGVDVAYSQKPLTGFSAISLFNYPGLEYITTYQEIDLIGYPYIPGLLSFREGPLIMDTLEKIEEDIDLFLFDGQGIAHPRGVGIASHLGFLLDKPSIGVAKTWLAGEYKEPGNWKGARSNLVDASGNLIGHVLRSRDDTNPLFVSPGHRIGIEEASEIVLNCTTGYRIPEPLRRAHQEAEKYKNEGDI